MLFRPHILACPFLFLSPLLITSRLTAWHCDVRCVSSTATERRFLLFPPSLYRWLTNPPFYPKVPQLLFLASKSVRGEFHTSIWCRMREATIQFHSARLFISWRLMKHLHSCKSAWRLLFSRCHYSVWLGSWVQTIRRLQLIAFIEQKRVRHLCLPNLNALTFRNLASHI